MKKPALCLALLISSCVSKQPKPLKEVVMYPEKDVKHNKYFGVHTQTLRSGFNVSNQRLGDYPEFVQAILHIKKAAAQANGELRSLTADQEKAIVTACDHLSQKYDPLFYPVDMFIGGGGTPFNMNVNEVVGSITGLSSLDHINMGQSTNDVIPSAVKITVYRLLGQLEASLQLYETTLEQKVFEFKDVVKIARTCMQDALPITLGQELSGSLGLARRTLKQLPALRRELLSLPLGSTAVGTGFGAMEGFKERVIQRLVMNHGEPYQVAENPFDEMQNGDVYLKVSNYLVQIATGAKKLAQDMRLMSSGPYGGLSEVSLPKIVPGSSIMPGKVNPIIPETMIQSYFLIKAEANSVQSAVENTELDLNIYEPVILASLYKQITLLNKSLKLFTNKALAGLTAVHKSKDLLAKSSYGRQTVLSMLFGYKRSLHYVQESELQNLSLEDYLLEKKLLSKGDLTLLFDPLVQTDGNRLARVVSAIKQRSRSL